MNQICQNDHKESLKLSSWNPSLIRAMDEESSKVDNKKLCKCNCGGEIPYRYQNGRKRSKNIVYLAGHFNKMENNGQWKGGRYIDDNGYVNILCKGHPGADKDGYVLEHRLIMEKHLGRYLTNNEHTHHINRIRDDNRIKNLQLCTSNSEHMRIHAIEDGRILPSRKGMLGGV